MKAIACAPVLLLAGVWTTLPAQNHPLISPFPGSAIESRSVKEFDQCDLPLGPLQSGKFSKILPLEGKVTLIGYRNPKGRSTLEMFRNYETALKQAGFQTLFSCALAQCGTGFADTRNLGRFYPMGANFNQDERYMAAKLARPGGDVYVAVYVSEAGGTTHLNVVELKPWTPGWWL